MQTLSPQFQIGTVVLYQPRHPDLINSQDFGVKAVIARYSQKTLGECFIEFPSGLILKVPESDLMGIQ